MADPKIKKGTKVSADEAKKLDRSKMGVSVAKPPVPEVEAQMVYLGYVECPWCATIGRAAIDTETYNWYTCGTCGGPFRA